MSLSPPQPLRARSSSIVQPLTIDSLRRTPQPLSLVCQSGLPTPPRSHAASPAFSSVFTRPPPSQGLPSPALSPRTRSPLRPAVPRRTYVAPLVLLASAFVLSLVPIGLALASLPIPSLRSFPRTIADIAALGRDLQAYSAGSAAGMAHVMGVMCYLAIWEHAWSVPGSVVLNVLAGALVSPLWGTLLMTLLTSIGSLVATLLAAPLSPLVQRFVPKALDVVSIALQGSGTPNSKRTPTWVRLVIMRLIGVVPWSGINIACGVCRVAFVDCAIGAFIGTLPWTAVTCQVGDILQTLAVGSSSSNPKTLSSLLSSPSIILKLVVLSLLSLGPVLFRNNLSDLLAGNPEPLDEKVPVSPRWKVWRWRRDSTDGTARPKSPERRLEEDLDEKHSLASS